MKSKLFKYGCLGIIIALFATGFVGCRIINKRYEREAINLFKLAIPAGINVGKNTENIVAMGYGLEISPGDKSCGGAIFKLSEQNIQDIKNDGLDFLSPHRYGRGGLSAHAIHGGHNYNAWQKTPVPSEYNKYFRDSRISCLRQIDNDEIVQAVLRAIKEDGSYYTQAKDDHIGRWNLFVIPDLEVIVYSFYR